MRSLITLCVAALFAVAGMARADQTATLPDGRSVLLKSDGTYKILPKLEVPAGSYQSMSMSDLKVDIKELNGKKVRVNANGLYIGDDLIISDPNVDFDVNGITVEIKDLPRDTRKWIVTKCADQCRVTVEGEVVSGRIMGPGLVAHTVKGR